jgi:hypothetical protein
MMRCAFAIVVALLLVTNSAFAFEVDQFRAGMSRGLVKEYLKDWNFDQFEDVSADVLLAYDLPTKATNRLFKFNFCNEKLVSFEQSLKASAKNFVTVTQNYVRQYGQPMRVDASTNVVSSGEKASMILYWRVRYYFVGLRYLNLPNGEDLAVVYEVNNNCWQAPRGQ